MVMVKNTTSLTVSVIVDYEQKNSIEHGNNVFTCILISVGKNSDQNFIFDSRIIELFHSSLFALEWDG